MIGIRDLRFRYPEGDFSLAIRALDIASAEAVAVIGPSGSGKTTLLNLIAGIKTPQEGCVTTNEVDLARLDETDRRDFRIQNIGLIFQEFELLEYLNVHENILLPYRINRSLKLDTTVRTRARRLAEEVGLGDKRDRLVGQLSQGERQRVAICRALLAEPKLLLADEPTGNLDPANKGRVLEILLEYAHRNRATLVAVTHDYDLLPHFQRVVDFKEFYDLGPSSRQSG